jgi:hypothetical protein
MVIKEFTDIKHVFYINLATRPDRKIHVENQLHNLGIKEPLWFNATKMVNGALGCSMSHLKSLQIAKDNRWPHVLIVEDDIEFLNQPLFIEKANQFFKVQQQTQEPWDVLLFAGNNMLPYSIPKLPELSCCCIQVHHCLTTTGYLVQSHYYDTLIQNYKEGIQLLLREPENRKSYAIDKYWIRLQEHDKWFLLIPPTVVQLEDYSDIEKRRTNFRDYMLNYNKCYKK